MKAELAAYLSFISIGFGYISVLFFVQLIAPSIGGLYGKRLHLDSLQRWLSRNLFRRWMFFYFVGVVVLVPLLATHTIKSFVSGLGALILVFFIYAAFTPYALTSKFLGIGLNQILSSTIFTYALKCLVWVSVASQILAQILSPKPSIGIILISSLLLFLVQKYLSASWIMALHERASSVFNQSASSQKD